MFDFNHIKPFDRAYIDNPGAMVVFATPGMLHAGLSLQIFKRWAPCENNMVSYVQYRILKIHENYIPKYHHHHIYLLSLVSYQNQKSQVVNYVLLSGNHARILCCWDCGL
jgi:Cft2 family RNA processing exonuclease